MQTMTYGSGIAHILGQFSSLFGMLRTGNLRVPQVMCVDLVLKDL